ncbi:MAG: polysaccharide pyruvyl transferase family protein [Verrucomicrobiales bacterium]
MTSSTPDARAFRPARPTEGMNRRKFLGTLSTALAASPSRFAFADASKRKHILLAGCRHDINIGDQAHTPGLLRLIESHIPGTSVTLWPNPSQYGPEEGPSHAGRERDLTPELRRMLVEGFPGLAILEPGSAGQEQGATRPDLVAAIERADLFITGSGGGVKGATKVWSRSTDKPWGAYGVTFSGGREFYSTAAFLFCRDSPSVGVLEEADIEGPVVEFGPDATFGLHLRDEKRADRFLQEAGLEDRKFLCVIPRLRYSPYYEMYGYEPSEVERERAIINEEFKESDHAAARELIVNWVRKTGWKVLACPEMTYGVPLSKEQLVDPLPEDVRSHVVWRDSFWLCDEAASVYAKALAVVSLDCHSVIMALAAGTPAIHLRIPTDNTFKSRMFADIGLPEWIHENEGMTGDRLTEMVMEIHRDYDAATAKVQRAMGFVRERQAATMSVVKDVLWREPV